MTFDLLDRDKGNHFRKLLIVSMIASMVLLIILGFLQLKYFGDFFELGMQLQGWDPHIGRLLSTWFDPNFIGGYLAFMLSITIALGLYFRHHQNRRLFLVLSAISVAGLIALYLTYSRSAILALVASLGILALMKSRKLLVISAVVIVMGFAVSPRVQDRFMDLWGTARVVFGIDIQQTIDPTAQLRLYSWQFAQEMISEYPLLGVGYNRYAYEINYRGHGLLDSHASTGSDSSILTLWATTGLFGMLSFLFIGVVATMTALRRIGNKADFDSYLQTGFLAGFGGVMVHSIFVNSLLYALMMVYLWISIGMMDQR
jgi:O-antigen ligase